MSSSAQSGLIVARLIELGEFLKRQQKSEHKSQFSLLLQRDVFCEALLASAADLWKLCFAAD